MAGTGSSRPSAPDTPAAIQTWQQNAQGTHSPTRTRHLTRASSGHLVQTVATGETQRRNLSHPSHLRDRQEARVRVYITKLSQDIPKPSADVKRGKKS